MKIQDTLAERISTHGDFTDNANTAQAIKDAMFTGTQKDLTPIMYEALEMIAHKIARILNGNPAHKDHWHDIAGYATLVEERL